MDATTSAGCDRPDSLAEGRLMLVVVPAQGADDE